MDGLAWFNVALAGLGIGLDIVGAFRDRKYHSRYFVLRCARIACLSIGYALFLVNFHDSGATEAHLFTMKMAFTFMLIALNMRGVYEFITRA